MMMNTYTDDELSGLIREADEDIDRSSSVISSLTGQLEKTKKKIRGRTSRRDGERSRKRGFLEEVFLRKHDATTSSVRADYVRLLEKHSYQGGVGYKVDVPGYNEKGVHHFVLREEARADCLPSVTIKEAFDIVDQKVYIADRVHQERWGN